MKITVIGTGYVGLVSGVCLADVGNDVLCLDVDAAKIRLLNEGGFPFMSQGWMHWLPATAQPEGWRLQRIIRSR